MEGDVDQTRRQIGQWHTVRYWFRSLGEYFTGDSDLDA